MQIGKYRILKKLGAGGSGLVYLASDDRIGKVWAIKKIPGNECISSCGVLILEKLDHPGIPRVVEEIEEDGCLYAVMDYVEGTTLHAAAVGGKVKDRQLALWGIEICRIFAYLHGQKIPVIFRDLKPSNLIQTKEGRVRLVDFDAARIGESTAGDAIGTKGFAAPEQYAGVYGKASDIYTIGKTLMSLSGHIRNRALRKILEKAAAENPAKRYPDAQQMADALAGFVRREERKQRRKNPAVLAVLLLLAAVFTGKSIAEASALMQYGNALTEENYVLAVRLRPKDEKLYSSLLEKYEKEGRTEEGIRMVKLLRENFPGETRKQYGILMEIGMLYLTGSSLDPSFRKDYAAAETYFSLVPESAESDVPVYQELAHLLCSFSEDIRWKQVAQGMLQLSVSDSGKDPSDSVRRKMLLADLYNTYAPELSVYCPEPQIQAAEQLLSAGQLLAEIENTKTKERLRAQILLRLSETYYLKSLKEGQEGRPDLSKAKKFLAEAQKVPGSGEIREIQIMKERMGIKDE